MTKCFPVLLVAVAFVPCSAQERSQRDLIASFDPAADAVSGEWTKDREGLRVQPSRGARARLAADAPSDYQLDLELTRVSGGDVVAVILPIGSTSAVLELSSWGGEAHGLARVDGQTSRSQQNPTSVRPGQLENDRLYRLSIRVRSGDDQVSVQAMLDGKPLVDWKGPTTRIEPHRAFNFARPGVIGLAASDSEVVFHKLTLTTDARVMKAPTDGGDQKWQPFNGARLVDGAQDAVLRAVPEAGSGDRGAYLRGVEFASGAIEVDLKGDGRPQQSFVGVAFAGVDGETYEAVYFRPFNFGSSDPVRRSHAVQYIAHPDWTWKRLRSERDGQYEQAVRPEPQPDDWFHTRIEVDRGQVRVFVNNSPQPSLQVERLSAGKAGRVGLWFNGIAAFRNFEVTDAKNVD